MTCLYNNPLMCVNKSASCFGALTFDNHLEMHLQKSGVTVSLMGLGFEDSVSVGVWHWCDVLLLVWNSGPSQFVAVSILTVALLSHGSLTNLERQSAALFHAPDIHSIMTL